MSEAKQCAACDEQHPPCKTCGGATRCCADSQPPFVNCDKCDAGIIDAHRRTYRSNDAAELSIMAAECERLREELIKSAGRYKYELAARNGTIRQRQKEADGWAMKWERLRRSNAELLEALKSFGNRASNCFCFVLNGTLSTAPHCLRCIELRQLIANAEPEPADAGI